MQNINFRMSYLSKLNLVDKGGTPALAPLCTFLPNVIDSQPVATSTFVGTATGRLLVLGDEMGTLTSWIIPARPKADVQQPVQIRPFCGKQWMVVQNEWKVIDSIFSIHFVCFDRFVVQ